MDLRHFTSSETLLKAALIDITTSWMIDLRSSFSPDGEGNSRKGNTFSKHLRIILIRD